MKISNLIAVLFIIMMGIASCSKDENKEEQKQKEQNQQSTGTAAHDLLSADVFNQLVVEFQYVNGFEPTSTAEANLKTFLESYLNKPNGITIVKTNISSPGKSVYSIDDIIAIEDANRTEFNKDQTVAAYFLFIDGEYSQNSNNSKVLGVAYRNTSMVIFEETIRDFSGGLGEPSISKVESTVLNHEFGHILGLVNLGTPMQTEHQDEAHGKHCDVTDCLMYYTTETSDFIGNLLGSDIPGLDSQCQADLKANGGK